MRVPVVDTDAARSIELDRLLADWQTISGAIAFNVEWQSRPRSATPDELVAHVEVAVSIESESANGLRAIYEKLTRAVKTNSIELSSRSCRLTDLFD
jgi:hypothetical protein